jgi:hypothetical protein
VGSKHDVEETTGYSGGCVELENVGASDADLANTSLTAEILIMCFFRIGKKMLFLKKHFLGVIRLGQVIVGWQQSAMSDGQIVF